MKVVLLGTYGAPFLAHTIEALRARDVPIAAALLDSKTESAKDTAIWFERTGGAIPWLPLHRYEAAAIPFYFVESHVSPQSIALLRALGADLAINAGTPRILTAEALAAPRHGVLNVHPGLLPEFRGCTCVEWAIHEDKDVGNTVHVMSPGIDEGPVLARLATEARPGDDYVAIRTRVYRDGFALMADTLRDIVTGKRRLDEAAAQTGGRYWKPIDDGRMATVLEKLASGRYASGAARGAAGAP